MNNNLFINVFLIDMPAEIMDRLFVPLKSEPFEWFKSGMKKGLTQKDLRKYYRRNMQCVKARKDVMNICWRGGDKKHHDKVKEVLDTAAACKKFEQQMQ